MDEKEKRKIIVNLVDDIEVRIGQKVSKHRLTRRLNPEALSRFGSYCRQLRIRLKFYECV